MKLGSRERRMIFAGVLFLMVGLNACSFRVTPTPLPTFTPTVTASPTVTPTAMPTVIPTATPFPTPNPQPLTDEIAEGQSRAQAQAQAIGGSLVCLQEVDCDDDGTPEWLALVHQAGPPGRLSAFVLDGAAVYPLEAATPKAGHADVGLGEYATCEVQVRDVNADGRTEIAVFGHSAGNETVLHLFAWDGGHYRRMGRFAGNAGVSFRNRDGDLADEVWEGYRVDGAPELAWYILHTWTGQSYGWTSDRYDWFTLERPHAYPTSKPEYAVISFYLALDDRDLPGAYHLLLPQDGRGYETWALGFATTLRVDVGDVHIIPGSADENYARVAAMVTAWDNQAGVVVQRLWNVVWTVSRTESGWRLGQVSAESLDSRPVSYWP